jgi:hypothetical protein
LFLMLAFVYSTASATAVAQPTDAPPAGSASSAQAPPPTRPQGLVVLALDGATDASWALASKVYGDPTLRPFHLDDAHARVLAGEAPAASASQDLRDLAQIRAAVHGDDAPSRQLLASLGLQLGVRGVVVVEVASSGTVSARVFVAETQTFDAARYTPDDAHSATWSGATASLSHSFGSHAVGDAGGGASTATAEGTGAPTPTMVPGPPGILSDSPAVAANIPKSFYRSPWFWGAVGSAVLAGVAILLATHGDTSGGQSIHLDVKVP